MRKIAIPTVAVAALSVAIVAPSYAQAPTAVTTITANPSVSPSKAGTKKKPQSVNLKINGTWKTSGPDGENKPIVQKIKIDFPKGSLYLGGSYKAKCTKSELDRTRLDSKDKLTGKCAKAVVGSGTGSAWADTVPTNPTFQVVNGGAKNVYVYTVLKNPARVTTPVPGVIKKGGKYGGYVLNLTVPQELQVVAGTPISLRSVNITTKAKNWLATTSCPKNKKWPYRVTSSQDTTADAVFDSSVKCTS